MECCERYDIASIASWFDKNVCRVIPAAQRAGVVNGIGKLVKEYMMSDAFAKDYEKYIRAEYGSSELQPKLTDIKWKEKEKRTYADQIGSIEASRKLLGDDSYKSGIEMRFQEIDIIIKAFEGDEKPIKNAYKELGNTLGSAKADKKELEVLLSLFETNKTEFFKKNAAFIAKTTVRSEFAEEPRIYSNQQKKQMKN